MSLSRRATITTAILAVLAATSLFVARAAGPFLVVEDRLKASSAIIVLGGEVPFRASEAARLYRDGWAPTLVLVPGAGRESSAALDALGIERPEEWELNREVLLRLGVPTASIVVAARGAEGTLEELAIAADTLASRDIQRSSPVILVTSPYHTRRVALTWQRTGGDRWPGLTRAATADPFPVGHWWRERRFVLQVAREYLGLANLALGFPVPARSG